MSTLRNIDKYFAFLLLLVFTAIQVAQCVHIHNEEESYITSVDTADTSDVELHKANSSCKVCNYYHQQSKHLHSSIAIPLSYINTEVAILSVGFTERLFESSVHTWTNRGPPLA